VKKFLDKTLKHYPRFDHKLTTLNIPES